MRLRSQRACRFQFIGYLIGNTAAGTISGGSHRKGYKTQLTGGRGIGGCKCRGITERSWSRGTPENGCGIGRGSIRNCKWFPFAYQASCCSSRTSIYHWFRCYVQQHLILGRDRTGAVALNRQGDGHGTGFCWVGNVGWRQGGCPGQRSVTIFCPEYGTVVGSACSADGIVLSLTGFPVKPCIRSGCRGEGDGHLIGC